MSAGELWLDLDAPAPVPTATVARKLTPRAQLLREAHERAPDARLVHVPGLNHGAGTVLAFGPDSPWHDLLPPWQYASVAPIDALPPIAGYVLVDNQPAGVVRDYPKP
jgi:hypothetical protein